VNTLQDDPRLNPQANKMKDKNAEHVLGTNLFTELKWWWRDEYRRAQDSFLEAGPRLDLHCHAHPLCWWMAGTTSRPVAKMVA